jgi:hypothetical protein
VATVKVEQNAAGDYAVGVEHEGVFIPVSTVSANRVTQLVERRQDLEQKAKDGDEAAQEALDSEYGAKPKSKSEDEKKGGGS